jgi:hypothetical protein
MWQDAREIIVSTTIGLMLMGVAWVTGYQMGSGEARKVCLATIEKWTSAFEGPVNRPRKSTDKTF